MNEKAWCLYVVETEEGLLYTGITKDLERRFQEHQGAKGAKFFRRSLPKVIRLSVPKLGHGEALKLEYAVKQLSREEKEALTRPKARAMLKRILSRKEKK